jgi:hypothetical protein
MKINRRSLLGGTLGAATLAAARSSGAVVVLDSTWRAEGGRPGHESEGFGAHIRLANQPQFASLVAFSGDDGESWAIGSGTWIGNVEGQGRILTAAHVFGDGEGAESFLYRTSGGRVHRGADVDFHPLWNGDVQAREGYDLAIVTLENPVGDAGPPPALFDGEIAVGTRVVMIGFGSRGIASVGERAEYYEPSDKAAAENIVDEVEAAERPVPHDGNAGNWFSVTMRREGEGALRLEGILGGGDSGGSTWLRVGSDWAIAGVNSNGTGDDTYGCSSFFAQVSGVQDWIAELVPGVRFLS